MAARGFSGGLGLFRNAPRWGLAALLVVFVNAPVQGSDADAFRVKREGEMAFEQPPSVTRSGDKVTISFMAKSFCDATVAVEDPEGRIVRHLASGLLGDNAPAPFQRANKRQTVVWDGKDDRGKYRDDADVLFVRVSLGLEPKLERTLFWDPRKRVWDNASLYPMFRAAPEGVYVYDGGAAFDHVTLFDHDGGYARTIYPFAADKIEQVDGISWKVLEPDGQKVPIRPNYQQNTFLTSGTSLLVPSYDPKTGEFKHPSQSEEQYFWGRAGRAATAFAVRDGKLALASMKLNRLARDGAYNGLPLCGPATALSSTKPFMPRVKASAAMGARGLSFSQVTDLKPGRAVFSPDGQWLYLARYQEAQWDIGSWVHACWDHAVYRVRWDDKEGKEQLQPFLGDHAPGADAQHFSMPADVACDAQGRVYVADYLNNRVQVFDAGQKLVATIPVQSPAQVCVHAKTGEIYVFSWPLPLAGCSDSARPAQTTCVLKKFGPVEHPKLLATHALPMPPMAGNEGLFECTGYYAEVDSFTTPATIWLSPGRPAKKDDAAGGILLVREKDGGLEIVKNFAAEVASAITRTTPPDLYRQRLYVNPKTGLLYVAEGTGVRPRKTFDNILEINPETGAVVQLDLPIKAEDMAFDIDGSVYLKPHGAIVRYDLKSWREIPFDYGEEMRLGKQDVLGAVPIPSNHLTWHHGGMGISSKGNIAVGVLYALDPAVASRKHRGESADAFSTRKYTPVIYPGRCTEYNYGAVYVHVWDKYGKLLYDDAVPGVGGTHGVCIDDDDNLYVLCAGRRILDGKPYFNVASCTVLKMKAKAGKIVGTGGSMVPLPADQRPNRPPEMSKNFGQAWAEGAQWMYGGVGWDAKIGTGCSCWNARIALDLFERTFAPETDRNSIAVLDGNGNLIVRVGRYGNIEDGKPLVAAGGPPGARSIGGDEVSLLYGMYPAVQSDRRLFVADGGNYRIASVKLAYHAEEKVALKNVKDAAAKE